MIKNKIAKILAALSVAGLSAGQLAAASEITTDISRLPKPAQEFAAKAYPNAKVVGIEIETSLAKPVEYDATLSDGGKIEFNASGEWTKIESKFSGVPASLLPETAAAHVEGRYGGQKIKSVSKKRFGWEVDLLNGLELKFDTAGKFIGVDD